MVTEHLIQNEQSYFASLLLPVTLTLRDKSTLMFAATLLSGHAQVTCFCERRSKGFEWQEFWTHLPRHGPQPATAKKCSVLMCPQTGWRMGVLGLLHLGT